MCKSRGHMMLICMAWHRHLASRYGGSTFFIFLIPLYYFSGRARTRSPAAGPRGGVSQEFLEQAGKAGEKPIIPAVLFFRGHQTRTIFPPCWRHSLRETRWWSGTRGARNETAAMGGGRAVGREVAQATQDNNTRQTYTQHTNLRRQGPSRDEFSTTNMDVEGKKRRACCLCWVLFFLAHGPGTG